MTYLILIEMDPSAIPKDLKERMNIMTPLIEMTKKDLDSGELKMWGVSPDGYNGFAISNQDLKTIYTKAQMVSPYAKFKVMPMLSLDEAVGAMKAM